MHKIPSDLEKIINNLSKEEFIFDFLIAYNTPKSTIARLKKGELNKLEEKGELLLRKKILFKNINTDLYSSIDNIKNDLKNNKTKPRFVIVTDFDKFLAFDTKVNIGLDIDFNQLHKHHDFFNPLIGIEKQEYHNETEADVKAANNLAKLFDEIVKDNAHDTAEQRHALNIFLSRLLFCYFAEDTNIFTINKFTSSLGSHTKVDGSDTHVYLEKLFEVFNSKDREESLPEYFNSFPYVNGKLFKDVYEIPKFTTKSRKLLIELGELDWSGINPDIFGSMMQAVMDSDERGNMGSHYTSVPNIMKVINPLFLDELNEEFEESIGSPKKLNVLLERISKIKFFDPACGSGNFLIIAYKEIRRLEIEILKEMGFGGAFGGSVISLSQFYGIELNDFAHETAKLSLYLAEHQMNVEFYNETGISVVSLPLKLGGNIVCGNATRVDWEEVCPKEEGNEIYLFGNPPYLGSNRQSIDQKNDMHFVFKGLKGYKKLDYISCWFYKAGLYILGFNSKFSFVSTNSINQGEQVSLLWPKVLGRNLEINFAYQSFKWNNNAKNNAKVIVIIIGIRNIVKEPKYIYSGILKKNVNNINYYLTDGATFIVSGKKKNFINSKNLERCGYIDKSDNLFFTDLEYNKFVNEYPNAKKFIRRLIGSQEMLKGIDKYALWVNENELKEVMGYTELNNRINKTFEIRGNNKLAYRFCKNKNAINNVIIVPRVSSANREYIPINIYDKNISINDSVCIMYDPEIYIFGIISSKMHMSWVKAVAGRLKNDFRYSSDLCYNTFPFPYISKKQKEKIEEYVYNILDEREKHSEKTLSEMYKFNEMPKGLQQAHHELDLAIERCYRPKPFENDEERLEYLFKMYEKMIAKENEK